MKSRPCNIDFACLESEQISVIHSSIMQQNKGSSLAIPSSQVQYISRSIE